MSRQLTLRHLIVLVTFAAGALFTSASAAQSPPATTRIAVEQFEPLHAQGLNILDVHSSTPTGHLGFSVGFFFSYEDDPLTIVGRKNNTNVRRHLLSGQIRGDLTASFGLFDIVELYIGLPAAFYQFGDSLDVIGQPNRTVEGSALGDLRIGLKGRILDPEDFEGFGLALALPLYIPTGDTKTFNGEGAVRVAPMIIVDWRHEVGVKLALNIGYEVRPERQLINVKSDDQLLLSLGADVRAGLDELHVQAVLRSAIQLEEDFQVAGAVEESSFSNTPVEGELALRATPIEGLDITAGMGVGFSRAVGSPDYRLFLGLGYTHAGQKDSDDDGVMDDDDQCVDVPEDIDQFEDGDGCPDDDNDNDGVPDATDGCPMKAEDIDMFEDDNGCPDTDNDEDRIADTEDSCPNEAEDFDGFEDHDGCPEPDNDRDGLRDDIDQCPNDAEDRDNFEDLDGCPDPDNDKDGIADAQDLCPTQPEDMDGVEDEDGCPDRDGQKVKVEAGRISILDKVFFATGRATIRKKSHKLLTEVAKVLDENPHVTSVRVEGHTDDRGPDDKNMTLSQERAESVKTFLVQAGIDAGRLHAVGYGEGKPLASNKRRSGRAKNRRVEFTILELHGQPVAEDNGTIEGQ